MAREACFNPAKTSLNACPLHRDYQLLVHYKNLPLLKQFMCPTMGNIMSPLRTGICLQAHLELEVALSTLSSKRKNVLIIFKHSPGKRAIYCSQFTITDPPMDGTRGDLRMIWRRWWTLTTSLNISESYRVPLINCEQLELSTKRLNTFQIKRAEVGSKWTHSDKCVEPKPSFGHLRY